MRAGLIISNLLILFGLILHVNSYNEYDLEYLAYCASSPYHFMYACGRNVEGLSRFKFHPQPPVAGRAPSTTSLTPNTAVCNVNKDLFDNGVYLKSACFVHQALGYEGAKHKCAEYNMNLFILNDEIVESHVLDAAERYPNGALWVNGKRTTATKNWKVFNYDGSNYGPLNSNIDIYSHHESGSCLEISGKPLGIYKAKPADCDNQFWVVCEHFTKTQSKPSMDSSKCLYYRDLYHNNKYIRSTCIISEALNYGQSRRKCAEYGMNLFMFDTAEVDEAFFEANEDIWKNHPGGAFWINGLRNPQTNKWYVYYPNRILKGPIYSEFEWVRTSSIHGMTSGDFLSLSARYGPYQGLGANHNAIAWPICEYNKNH